MKVLHIAAGNLFGGVERMLITLAGEGARVGGMESHFAASFEGVLSQSLRAIPAPVWMMGAVRTRAPWTIGRARENLRLLLAEGHYDVVVCHSAWCQAIFAPVVRKLKIPQVFWLHDVPRRLHWLDQWAGRCPPDLAICNSNFTRSYLYRVFPKARSVVIYCPVRHECADQAMLERLRGDLAQPSGSVTIIHASRMQAGKGHRVLLNALSRLEPLPDWSCWIVGGPQRASEQEYFASLGRQADALGLSRRVRFLGQRQDAPVLMQLADIHCQPNESPEPFGIAFVEALYCGLPVVTTGFGGATEIVDETCGRLVAPGHIQQLSEVLATLVGDSDLRRKLGLAGREHAHSLCNAEAQYRRIRDALALI